MMSRPFTASFPLAFAAAGLACASALLGCSSGGSKGTLLDARGCDPAVDAVCGGVGAECQSGGECTTGACSASVCVAVGPDGTPIEVHGRYTDVKAERDGRWVYLVDHGSVPTSAQEPPEPGM